MLEIKNIHKSFGRLNVLNGVDIHIRKGDVVSIIGPSGSGKTTLLRCINFLESADSGYIRIGNISADFSKIRKREKQAMRRKTAMVFQNYALFYNMTALENVMEGLVVVQKIEKQAARAIALSVLEKVGLGEKTNAKPCELSGGQQQRVGIARAVALNPEIILFDEPTSSIDPEMVEDILSLIKELARGGATMAIVTHEMQFACEISNRVIFFDNGKILAEGSPAEIFDHPKEERIRQFVARFNLKRAPEYYL
ncbi:MAG: amino acid ABC transporter ATP-binding protein [Spirochaetaceae bacterium]|jgi:L-cystine transport system ATP-binding protein|nr:amino acid ABC transporter ATP-binding protein [Spirochaetaceae bacterium]